ncbi:MAG TPA: CBS domain-containing protein [Myxococcota bacterium]|jgi:CBS domain-containing protein|nr:CBS domain-containing protein [Myxococcota bacterium]
MDPAKLRVADLMTRDVATVRPGDKLSVAEDVMRLGRIRHLPVVDEHDETKVVGMLSLRDLFRGSLANALGYGVRAQQKLLDMLTVKEAMTSPVITATPDTPLRDAARLMLERKLGSLPVLEGGRLVGILTESDFVGLVAKG